MVQATGLLFLKELSMFLSFNVPNIETVFIKTSGKGLFRIAVIIFRAGFFSNLISAYQDFFNFSQLFLRKVQVPERFHIIVDLLNRAGTN